MNLLVFIVIGAIAGWLAAFLMKGKSGLIWNIIMGCIGSTVGGLLFDGLGIQLSNGFVGAIVTATVGAVLVIFLSRILLGRK